MTSKKLINPFESNEVEEESVSVICAAISQENVCRGVDCNECVFDSVVRLKNHFQETESEECSKQK